MLSNLENFSSSILLVSDPIVEYFLINLHIEVNKSENSSILLPTDSFEESMNVIVNNLSNFDIILSAIESPLLFDDTKNDEYINKSIFIIITIYIPPPFLI